MRRFLWIPALLLLLAFSFRDDLFALRKSLEIFARTYQELVTGYVDPLDPERTMRRGLEAMLTGLDPYTNLIDERSRLEAYLMQTGVGVAGVTLERRGDRWMVASPQEGVPLDGYRQGLRAGDAVVTLGGQPAERLTGAEVSALLRGAPGSTLEMTVQRPGSREPLTFTLVRTEVRSQSVSWSGFLGPDTTQGLALIRLSVFGQESASEMRTAVQTLLDRGEMTGLVLDLRDNPGGLLDQAVEIVGLFVPLNTTVVTTRGRAALTAENYRTQQSPIAPDVPLVVLVNGFSASASEIVAGALQDLDRAVIIGEPTFGKGLIQQVKPLVYGIGIKLTVGRYLLPSGRQVQRLDYGQHDGSVRTVADSLQGQFFTRARRPVEGGGGVTPDLRSARPAPSELEAALDQAGLFLSFAASRPEHASAQSDDRLLAAFRTFAQQQGFAYTSEAQRQAQRLDSLLQAGSYPQSRQRLTAVQTELRREEAEAWSRHREALVLRLTDALAAREEVLRPEAVRSRLQRDPLLREALDLLGTPSRYTELLRP